MFHLIVATFLTLATFADLETFPDEWIASGVDVSRETLVEFTAHGEMFNGDSGSYVGCHVAFVNDEGQEKWRAVVVYADRVILFQEDREPVITPHDYPAINCYYSESGEYVAMFDGSEVDTGRNGMRINTETGETTYFDSEPDGSQFTYALVWEDGSILFARSTVWEMYEVRFYFLAEDLTLNVTHDLRRSRNIGKSDSLLIMSHTGGYICFNSHGDTIWENTGGVRSMQEPAIIENAIFLIPTFAGIELRSCSSGELIKIYPYPERTNADPIVLSPDRRKWLCSYVTYDIESSTNIFRMYHGNLQDLSASISPSSFSSIALQLEGFSFTNMLVYRIPLQTPDRSRYIVTDDQFRPIYSPKPGLSPAEAKLSVTGDRFLFVDNDGIYLSEIGE